jgi:hypothetical protein
MEHLLDANHGSSGLEREQHKSCAEPLSPGILDIIIFGSIAVLEARIFFKCQKKQLMKSQPPNIVFSTSSIGPQNVFPL